MKPVPWVGTPPVSPQAPRPREARRSGEPGPIWRRWRLLQEASGRGKEKREEKKLLMHIVSVELSMTN